MTRARRSQLRFDPPIRYLARAFFRDAMLTWDFDKVARLVEATAVHHLIPVPGAALTDKSGKAVSVLLLWTRDSSLRLNITPTSADIERLPLAPRGKNMGTFEAFLKVADSILAPAIEVLGLAPPVRLAAVQEGFQAVVSKDEEGRLAGSLLQLCPFFKENPPFEWDYRMASRVHRPLSDAGETPLNILLTIKRLGGTQALLGGTGGMDFDRVRLDLDVNTAPDRDGPGFSTGDISAFFKGCKVWHGQLARQTVELLRGGADG